MTDHLIVLVEEPSMEAFLLALLPRLIPRDRTFEVHPFQGKSDLLKKLTERLRGYASWLPDSWRILVIVDRDEEDCHRLKQRLEHSAEEARIRSRSHVRSAAWQLVNRIAIEELEAWYFGDWQAVIQAYPRVSPNIPARAPFRDPDQIQGGTWEAFERVMKSNGYFRQGLRKIEVARLLGSLIDPVRSTSESFRQFYMVIEEAFGQQRA